MEPIPLRTLIVLLNYERMISNPLFEGVRLLQSTLTEPTLIWDLTGHARAIMYTPGAPTSIKQTNVHIFERYIEPKTSDTPSTTCAIHPAAGPETKALTPSQRELVYHETRGHSSCFKAIGLFNTFFKLCPPGQKLSIQIRNEEPVLVDPRLERVFALGIQGPKYRIIATGLAGGIGASTGSRDNEKHSVLGFSNPSNPKDYFIVDMTRMQYGEAARGLCGENYFLGTWDEFISSMKKICEGVRDLSGGKPTRFARSHDVVLEAWVDECAEKVWKRWNERGERGWCEHCGKPDSDGLMKNCGACKKNKIKYCCKEHQVAGWKLHKHTCKKNKS